MPSGCVPGNVEAVAEALRRRYADYSHGNKRNPLSELLFILCSIQTDEQAYTDTYRRLKRAFPTSESLLGADRRSIASVMRDGGLYRQKADAIWYIVRQLDRDFGAPSLAALKQMSSDDAEKYLLSLHGVGVKTARCVMMYSLGHEVFPVDTHCWRISRRLGWVRPTRPDRSCSAKDMNRLQAKIPREYRYSLHVNMVSLGRDVCQASHAKCERCVVSSYCKQIGV